MRRRLFAVLRGLLAAGVLLLVVAGVPVLLVREVGWPLPTSLPSWDEVARTLTSGAITDSAVITGLAVVVWLAWANFTTGVLIEVVGLVRGRSTRAVVGLGAGQHLAANLLATASIAIAALSRPGATPASDPGQWRLTVAVALADQPPQLLELGDSAVGAVPAGEVPAPDLIGVGGARGGAADWPVEHTHEVQHGDTFWSLAERFLGDGLRWRDIRDRNIGRTQPGGERIEIDTEVLLAGWTLIVPGHADADVVAEPQGERSAGHAPVTVERGDTLWDIADEHLDDPRRWPEVYEENRGVPQPDGSTLTDPDLIQPGWVLDMPATATVTDTEATVPPEEPADANLPAVEGDEPVTVEPDAEPNDETASYELERVDGDEGTGVVPPAASPTPVESASAEHVEQRRPGPVEVVGDDIPIVPIGVAGTVAAGLVLTLDRIRRTRLRRRQPQHRIPLPTGDELGAEQRLRLRADPETGRFVDLALRQLASQYAASRPTPPIVLASYGLADIAVHLDAASDAPPEGWEPHDGDLTWSRPRPPDLADIEVHAGTPSRLPALITLGALAGGRIGLLNLAHVGCLHLDGQPEIATTLMAAWALELATTPRADALDVVAVGLAGLPTGLERLSVLDTAEQLRDVLSRPHSNGHTNNPRTVVLAAGLPADVNMLLRTASELRPDLVAVTTDLQPRSGNWTVHVGEGRGRLDPEGVTFDLLDLGPETVPLTARLIQQALHDPDQLVPIPDYGDDPEPQPIVLDDADGSEGPEREDEEGPTADAVPRPGVEVRVLGPVEIAGAAESFRTNKTIELIVYLALHRSGADADTLLEALWPDQQPRPARLYTEASRARKALGTAEDGAPHLPDAELGRYRLALTVALDYERFAEGVASAHSDPDNAIDHLRNALMLVRGVPLSVTATEYAWTTNEVYRLAQEVVDAAHDLAQFCIEAERYDDAIWAAERGLLADPLAEVLVRDLMEAAAATGNTARVHAAMTRLRRQVAEDGDANDADDWLHPETLETFSEATR